MVDWLFQKKIKNDSMIHKKKIKTKRRERELPDSSLNSITCSAMAGPVGEKRAVSRLGTTALSSRQLGTGQVTDSQVARWGHGDSGRRRSIQQQRKCQIQMEMKWPNH
jgi:hypothetical protein